MSLIRSSLNLIALSKSFSRSALIIQNQSRNVHRWVAPTLRELKKRANKIGLAEQPNPRNQFLEWNYRSELFAFGKRLNEEFQLPLLQAAFTERSYVNREVEKQRSLGIEDADIKMQDNKDLAEQGGRIINEYVQAFLQHSLPNIPSEGRQSVANYLQNTETLSHIASHLGMKDLIFSIDYPPSKESLAEALKAVIGALAESSGTERAFLFVRDFVCTQLNQKDLTEIWEIKEPFNTLKAHCSSKNLEEPEPRLIGDSAKNTVLAAYEVGIYVNKKMLGRGFGEDVNTAIETAALDVLLKEYGLGDSMKPFDFKINVQAKQNRLKQ